MTAHQHLHDQRDKDHAVGAYNEAAMAELLDLDAEVLHAYLSDATAWVSDVAGGPRCDRILDVGAGTGTGTMALLKRFPNSRVTDLDVSAAMLGYLSDKAHELALADRVRIVQADLDAPWPAVGPFDLVWASSSLHHMADPARALAEIFRVLRPGGLLAVTEMDDFPRFLPDNIGFGQPGLEERCHAALAQARAGRVPHQGSDWRSRLSQAGFTIEAERAFTINLSPPLPPATGRYARASLLRMRDGLGSQLSAGDLSALDTLTEGADPVLERTDLTVQTTRTGWLASRP